MSDRAAERDSSAAAAALRARIHRKPPSRLPSALRILAAHELEDVLCIFKDRLMKARPKGALDLFFNSKDMERCFEHLHEKALAGG